MTPGGYGTEGWEAYVRDDPMRRKIMLSAGRHFPMFVEMLTAVGADGAITERVEENEAAPQQVELPYGLAMALHLALLEHFGGPGPSRELRKDHEDERKRVDRLIEHLVSPPQVTTNFREAK